MSAAKWTEEEIKSVASSMRGYWGSELTLEKVRARVYAADALRGNPASVSRSVADQIWAESQVSK